MWEWMSINPGRRVIPDKSISVAARGALISAAGPTAAIWLFVTRTDQPSRVWPSASKTRAGFSRMAELVRARWSGSPAASRVRAHASNNIDKASALTRKDSGLSRSIGRGHQSARGLRCPDLPVRPATDGCHRNGTA